MSLDKFADMLKFGINLKLSGDDETRYYAQRLRFYIMEMEDFDCESENDEDLDIYLNTECVLKVKIKNSILTFEPAAGDAYDAIMVVLSFVSTCHDIVQEDFKKVNDKYGLGLDISNLNKKVNNTNSPKLELPESLINKIKKKYKLDYDEVYS